MPACSVDPRGAEAAAASVRRTLELPEHDGLVVLSPPLRAASKGTSSCDRRMLLAKKEWRYDSPPGKRGSRPWMPMFRAAERFGSGLAWVR